MAYTDIDKPSDYFNTVTWTGDNTDRTISGVGFQPDWIWWKQRNGTDDHRLIDSVRGEGTTSYKILFSDTADAETDGNDNGGSQGNINAITSDGFSGVQGTVGWNNWNGTGLNYVGWNWLAANTTASNTDGSIASTVSANTTAGFSIVSYTGTGANATVGHGLGSAPKMIILKNRDSAENWIVGNTSLDWTKYLALNLTDATTTASNIWQNTAPTSSVFSIGDSGKVNGSGNGMVAYCFAEKKGFSKFGKYTGNGSTDGAFVYTGFKPAYVMTKRTDSIASWVVWDNKRDIDNGVYNALQLNDSAAEITASYYLDFLSNGFKWRVASGATNASGGTYIFMAFAENPFTTSTGIPTTAR